MKGKNASIQSQRAKYVVTDLVTTAIAFFLFNVFRYYALGLQEIFSTLPQFLGTPKLLVEEICVPIGLSGLYWLSGYYNRPFDKSRLEEFSVTFYTTIASTIIIFLLMLINDVTGMKSTDYMVILMLFALLLTCVYTGRRIITNITISHIKKRRWIYTTLIVGNSRKSRQIYKSLKQSGSVWAYNVIGFIRLDHEHQVEDEMPTWPWDDIERVCREEKVDQIILAPERPRDTTVMKILERLFPLDIPVKIMPDTLSYVTSNIRMNDILGVPLVELTSPRIGEFQKNVKRFFDVSASLLTMIFLSPVLLATAIAVKLSSPGPVIYTQERIGKGQKPFYIYKFRSMRTDAEANGPRLSRENDPRITPWGRIMRKYRIDELPQFWNVLRGDMSLVGPRPERDYFIRQIIAKAPYYGLIFQIRPGVTSWGMVQFGYASSVDEMVTRSRYDLIYINNMSISTDIKILIYTVRTVLRGSGK